VISGVSFTWTSSSPSVVRVDEAVAVEALDVGSSTVRASGGGTSGSLDVRVADADLAGITALATDAFLEALVGASSAGVRSALEAAIENCTAAAAEGRLEAIEDCVAAVRAEATSASDPTDRALLAVLSLFLDRVERLLNL
jgi:hypothetical protein